jgi:preprotein translocase subunit SecE
MLGVQVPPGLPVFIGRRVEGMEKIKLILQKIIRFLSEAKLELKRVTWPTPKQTLASTTVVIVIVFIVAIYLGIIDYVLARLVKFILG